MSNNNDNNIWLQPGTRAHMLVYKPETNSWQVWTSTNTRSGDSSKWLGTYMELFSDGMCLQHYRSETDIHCITVRQGQTQYDT
jgi:hypothetical protein